MFKCVEYCQWFRQFLTANGKYILDITLLVVKCGSVYLDTSALTNNHIWPAFIQHEIIETLLHD
jgi:hypothetical protein